MSQEEMPMDQMPLSVRYRRLVPKRPMVIRKGDLVKTCYFYNGMKECLGARCYWPKVGKCHIHNRLYTKKNGKNGKSIVVMREKPLRKKAKKAKGKTARKGAKRTRKVKRARKRKR